MGSLLINMKAILLQPSSLRGPRRISMADYMPIVHRRKWTNRRPSMHSMLGSGLSPLQIRLTEKRAYATLVPVNLNTPVRSSNEVLIQAGLTSERRP